MYLARLSLSNFRAFFEAELTLESTGLALVAGANNAGKSALLSALDLVAGRPPAPPSRFHGSDEPAVVEVKFRLSEEDRATVLRDATFAQAWVRETPVFRTVILRWSDEGNTGSLVLTAVETESLNATIGPIATARTSGGVQTVSWINAVGLASAAPKDAPREWQEISADNTSTGSPGDVLRGLPGAGALSDLSWLGVPASITSAPSGLALRGPRKSGAPAVSVG